jgi:hypothetical protein
MVIGPDRCVGFTLKTNSGILHLLLSVATIKGINFLEMTAIVIYRWEQILTHWSFYTIPKNSEKMLNVWMFSPLINQKPGIINSL